MTIPELESRLVQLFAQIGGLEDEKRVIKAEQERVLFETQDRLSGLKQHTDRLHTERAALVAQLDLLLPRDPNRQDANILAGGNR